MITRELDFTLNSEHFSEVETPRSPGLHLSTIIKELDEAAHPGNRLYADADDATRQAYFTVGFMWEQILTHILMETSTKTRRGELIRPGEFVVDGIAMSPDAIDLQDYALEEYKATYLSSFHPIEDKRFWRWIVQMKCYCRAIGTRTARLRVFFLVGDWRGSGPQTKAWQFEFTEREIEETWAMVVNHARARGYLFTPARQTFNQ